MENEIIIDPRSVKDIALDFAKAEVKLQRKQAEFDDARDEVETLKLELQEALNNA